MKKLNESVWSDIHGRSNGSSERKEDSIEHLNRDGLLDYIYEKYDEINKYESTIPVKSENSTYKWFQIPIFQFGKYGNVFRIIVKFDGNKIFKICLDGSTAVCKEFIDKLKEKFEVITDGLSPITITSKTGKVTNKICLEIIDIIIENTEFPKLKKKEE